jgi:ribulose-bisphosphate carboxylase large chain
MDQSNRYADLSLREDDLIKGGRHILVAYKMKPKAGYDYLQAAAHFAAESSTGTNVEVCTTDEFTRGVDALVYLIDEADEEMRIAYPLDLFDRNVTDGRMMIVSFLTLVIGNNQGMGDIEHAKIYDFYMPERAIQLFDGPAKDISDLWRILGRPVKDGGYIAGTIIKPKLGLRPEPFAKAAYQFWLGGDFIKNDEPQGNQVFAPMKKVMPLVYDAMKRAQDETGQAKLFSANITADDHYEMCARADYILETFGPDADKVAFLVDGYVGGPGMVTTARRQYPNQYLHYHRAGHGAVTSPSSKRGYDAYVLAKMSRLQGASGIHVGTMGYGKMEGSADDRAIAYVIERDEYQGPAYHQKWYGMKPTTPIISGGMNALRLPGFFANLGHGNVINTSGGGLTATSTARRPAPFRCDRPTSAGKPAPTQSNGRRQHQEFARAFESFPGDADSSIRAGAKSSVLIASGKGRRLRVTWCYRTVVPTRGSPADAGRERAMTDKEQFKVLDEPFYQPARQRGGALRSSLCGASAGDGQGSDRLRQVALHRIHGLEARQAADHGRLQRRHDRLRSGRALPARSQRHALARRSADHRCAHRRHLLPRRNRRGASGHHGRHPSADRPPAHAAARQEGRTAARPCRFSAGHFVQPRLPEPDEGL